MKADDVIQSSTSWTFRLQDLTAGEIENAVSEICKSKANRSRKSITTKVLKLDLRGNRMSARGPLDDTIYDEQKKNEKDVNITPKAPFSILLERFTVLTTLNLSRNSLFSHHLSELGSVLPKLTHLNLSQNRIENLLFLQGKEKQSFENLLYLQLNNNNLKDLQGLEVLKSLKGLQLSKNAISSLKPISQLLELDSLDASNNLILCLEEIKYLHPVHQLQTLKLVGNPVAEHTCYQHTTLQYAEHLLILDGNRLPDVKSDERMHLSLLCPFCNFGNKLELESEETKVPVNEPILASPPAKPKPLIRKKAKKRSKRNSKMKKKNVATPQPKKKEIESKKQNLRRSQSMKRRLLTPIDQKKKPSRPGSAPLRRGRKKEKVLAILQCPTTLTLTLYPDQFDVSTAIRKRLIRPVSAGRVQHNDKYRQRVKQIWGDSVTDFRQSSSSSSSPAKLYRKLGDNGLDRVLASVADKQSVNISKRGGNGTGIRNSHKKKTLRHQKQQRKQRQKELRSQRKKKNRTKVPPLSLDVMHAKKKTLYSQTTHLSKKDETLLGQMTLFANLNRSAAVKHSGLPCRPLGGRSSLTPRKREKNVNPNFCLGSGRR